MCGSTAPTSARIGRLVTIERAEIAGQRLPQEDRRIAPRSAGRGRASLQRRHRRGRRAVAEDRDRRIAGHDPHDHEHQRQHRQQRRDRRQQPPDDVERSLEVRRLGDQRPERQRALQRRSRSRDRRAAPRPATSRSAAPRTPARRSCAAPPATARSASASSGSVRAASISASAALQWLKLVTAVGVFTCCASGRTGSGRRRRPETAPPM